MMPTSSKEETQFHQNSIENEAKRNPKSKTMVARIASKWILEQIACRGGLGAILRDDFLSLLAPLGRFVSPFRARLDPKGTSCRQILNKNNFQKASQKELIYSIEM